MFSIMARIYDSVLYGTRSACSNDLQRDADIHSVLAGVCHKSGLS